MAGKKTRISRKAPWARDGAIAIMHRFGKPYSRILARGVLATLAVVGLRLAMPWPLKGVLELASASAGMFDTWGMGSMPGWLVRMAWLGGGYIAIAAGLGLTEMIQRVAMKQYASYAVRDLRDQVVAALRAGSRFDSTDIAADMITRLVGDSARIKAEWSGILVHATQNGLLFAGICLLFLVLSPGLAVFFLVGGLCSMAIGFGSAGDIADEVGRLRRKEGDFAGFVQDATRGSVVETHSQTANRDVTRRDVRVTRMIARSVLSIHVLLAILTAGALTYAVFEVRSGALTGGELFLFVAYVLTVHRRMIQVGRQFARSGKLFAHIDRLAELLDQTSSSSGRTEPLAPLTRGFSIVGGRLRGAYGRPSRVRGVDLHLAPGSRTLVVGRPGSGKSSLLYLCAGHGVVEGEFRWDDRSVEAGELYRSGQLRIVDVYPAFRTTRLGDLAGVSKVEDLEIHADLMNLLRLNDVFRRARKGLDSKVSSATLTPNEARSIALFRLLTQPSGSIWLLDEPTLGLSRMVGRRLLDRIFDAAGDRVVVATSTKGQSCELFGEVVVMKRGKPVFVGPVAQWRLSEVGRAHSSDLSADPSGSDSDENEAEPTKFEARD